MDSLCRQAIQQPNVDILIFTFSTRLRGVNYRVCGVYSPEPRGDVYCIKLNFKISKWAYCGLVEMEWLKNRT